MSSCLDLAGFLAFPIFECLPARQLPDSGQRVVKDAVPPAAGPGLQ